VGGLIVSEVALSIKIYENIEAHYNYYVDREKKNFQL
jgi:hypothetical protein